MSIYDTILYSSYMEQHSRIISNYRKCIVLIVLHYFFIKQQIMFNNENTHNDLYLYYHLRLLNRNILRACWLVLFGMCTLYVIII